MWGSCLQRLPSQAEYEIALLQSDSSITCCLKLPFAAEVKELLKTYSKVQSSKSCGDFREVLFLLFQKREKSKSEGFLSLPFVTLFSHPSPARSLTPFSFPLLNSGKPKLPEIVSACKFLLKNPIFAFCIELKKQLQFFQSVYWERVPKRVRRFRFLRFGFAYGSSGSRFLRFVNYLIFYGSVPRFRFGSRTFLKNLRKGELDSAAILGDY